jgi:hypothetical protein
MNVPEEVNVCEPADATKGDARTASAKRKNVELRKLDFRYQNCSTCPVRPARYVWIRFITERDGTDRSAFIRSAIARATAGTLMRYATEHGQPVPSVDVNMLADALPSQAA